MQFLETNARRVVIKIGTHSVANTDGVLRIQLIRDLCEQIAGLHKKGIEVLVISSGAIGMGVGRLGLDSRPADLATLQACAAVGQSRLVEAWQTVLQEQGLIAAQVLLTHEDIRGRKRHLAVRNTIEKLLSMGVVPVVNENDTVSADEIKFGDNDILSALLASLVKADLLVILSTISGLMENQGEGALIPVVKEITEEIHSMAGGSTDMHSTGGMITKIEAAKLATRSGCGVFIGAANHPRILEKIHNGKAQGTFFLPKKLPMVARKRWIAFFEKPQGRIVVDSGAAAAMVERNSSLLAKGIISCEGNFSDGEVVTIHDSEDKVLARGIVSFGNHELESVIGKNSEEIRSLYPSKKRCEVVHKDSLVLF
jgi:glutamate 5-kinase